MLTETSESTSKFFHHRSWSWPAFPICSSRPRRPAVLLHPLLLVLPRLEDQLQKPCWGTSLPKHVSLPVRLVWCHLHHEEHLGDAQVKEAQHQAAAGADLVTLCIAWSLNIALKNELFLSLSSWHSLCPESWHLFAGLDYLDALIAPHMTKVVDGLCRSVWRCLDCGKDFKLKGDMSRHVEAFHITHPGLQCDLCEKVLKTRESMRSHMNNVHKNENLMKYNFWIKLLPFCHSLLIVIDFSVDVDCFTAWSADHREVDEKIETLIGRLPEGAFVCHVCGYSNNTKQNMKKHVETHIETPGYPCAFCQKHFKTRNSLNTHVSTHHREERKNQLNLSF